MAIRALKEDAADACPTVNLIAPAEPAQAAGMTMAPPTVFAEAACPALEGVAEETTAEQLGAVVGHTALRENRIEAPPPPTAAVPALAHDGLRLTPCRRRPSHQPPTATLRALPLSAAMKIPMPSLLLPVPRAATLTVASLTVSPVVGSLAAEHHFRL
jgi:hypothetical protein